MTSVSDKIWGFAKDSQSVPDSVIDTEDVKEFIKKLKEDIDRRWNSDGDLIDFNDRDIKKFINKLAGEKLI